MRKLLALSALFALLGLTSCGFGGKSDEVLPEGDGEQVDTPVNNGDEPVNNGDEPVNNGDEPVNNGDNQDDM